jgi:lipid II:glycine glycyltransferase (peptidoglycan interpeptide bridge formation enzyme)
MISRDEYVNKLKAQIDHWNAEMAKWQAQAQDASKEYAERYAKQLEQFRGKRDEAIAELRRLQHASSDAWSDMMRGAESALKSWQEAFEKARKNFEKK